MKNGLELSDSLYPISQSHHNLSAMFLNAGFETSGDFPSPAGHSCQHGMWHPTTKILEYVPITKDLVKRLGSQQTHIAVFANETELDDCSQGEHDPKRHSRDPVYFNIPVSPTSPMDGFSNINSNWSRIVGQLIKLKDILESGVTVPNMAKLMHDTIKGYCPEANRYSNFETLSNLDTSQHVTKCIPKIILLAIQLPMLLSKPIPILKVGDNQTVYLTRKLIASLLANAFFCTFPEPGNTQRTPDFNFFALFHTDPKHAQIKREKLKCIFNYFEKMSNDTLGYSQIVSFERRCVKHKASWATSIKSLNPVTVDSQGKIEDCRGMLQVDFANKMIGGGVYREGCVMEDIRFCISPELVVARLFVQNMENEEVVVVTGSEIYSEYMGYGKTFKYKSAATLNFKQATDTFGRTYTQIVAMDAQYFKADNKQQQYEPLYLERELHKCFVAFIHGPNFVSPLATGNWGCGQFNGDKELKFLIQWMAASIQDRPKVQFHSFGDIPFTKAIEDISDFLHKKNISVGELYKVVSKFHSDYKKHGKGGIFKYVKNKI